MRKHADFAVHPCLPCLRNADEKRDRLDGPVRARPLGGPSAAERKHTNN